MSTGPRILLCTTCNQPLGRCQCEPEEEPVEGDLVTEDLVHFFKHNDRRSGPVVTVDEGKSWRIALLCWMYQARDYPNVFHSRDGRWTMLALALAGDDADDDE